MKEEILFSSLFILVIFQSFYFFMYPDLIGTILVGALLGFFLVGIVLSILAGLKVGFEVLGSGVQLQIGENSLRLITVVLVVMSVFFGIRTRVGFGDIGLTMENTGLNTSGINFQIGLGLLYPTAYDLFVPTPNNIMSGGLLGFIGFAIITILMMLTIVSAVLIAL